MKQTRTIRWFGLPALPNHCDVSDNGDRCGDLTKEQSEALLICIFDSLLDDMGQPKDRKSRTEVGAL